MGVPFTFTHLSSATNQDTVQVALYWFLKTAGVRRQQYPSWSPLGWKGPIEFYALNQPITPAPTNVIEFQLNNKWLDLPRIDSKSHVTFQLGQQVPLLRVNALAFELPLTTVSGDNLPGSPDDLWIHCPHAPPNLDICVLPIWDRKPVNFKQGQSIIAVMLGEPGASDFASFKALLLEDQGSHYERIGIVVFPWGYWQERRRCCYAVVRAKNGKATLKTHKWLEDQCRSGMNVTHNWMQRWTRFTFYFG
jgi:hypothetical protein